MKPQTIDPLEERLNKPIEIIETFRKLLPADQFDVCLALFNLFSLSDQESLLEVLYETHHAFRDDDDD